MKTNEQYEHEISVLTEQNDTLKTRLADAKEQAKQALADAAQELARRDAMITELQGAVSNNDKIRQSCSDEIDGYRAKLAALGA